VGIGDLACRQRTGDQADMAAALATSITTGTTEPKAGATAQ
jgi:hypothetical protein